jgi:hypothetical protein
MAPDHWAGDVEALFAPLGDRWTHIQAVAAQAGRIASVVLSPPRERP